MSKGESRRPNRRNRFSKRNREMRDRRERIERDNRAASADVEAHEPEHETGCLTCMVARLQARQR